MNKIIFAVLALMLVLFFGCTQEVQKPKPSLALPAPGSEDVGEMIVVEESHVVENQIEEEQETKVEQIKEGSQTIVKEFIMTAKKWEFTPSTITVNQGDIVKITITSTDGTHGFSLRDFDINERLEHNIPVTIEFVADKSGTFPFRCNIPCGSGHSSMDGTLVVQ